jgi:hypothetical protein
MFWLGTPVPKATINKHYHTITTECEIRIAENSSASAPSRYVMFSKNRDHPNFGILVTATADS